MISLFSLEQPTVKALFYYRNRSHRFRGGQGTLGLCRGISYLELHRINVNLASEILNVLQLTHKLQFLMIVFFISTREHLLMTLPPNWDGILPIVWRFGCKMFGQCNSDVNPIAHRISTSDCYICNRLDAASRSRSTQL